MSTPTTKSTSEQKDFVRKLVIASKINRDSLPYHKEFDALYTKYGESNFKKLTKKEFWSLILRCTKTGGTQQPNAKTLPKVSRTDDETFAILALLSGMPGARDQLPYTEEFDAIYEQFKEHFKRNLTKNTFWRLVSSTAKKSPKQKVIDIKPDNEISKDLIRTIKRLNPWWMDIPFQDIPIGRRPIYHKILTNLPNLRPKIQVIRGPRQVGKSTLLQQMIFDLLTVQGVAPKQIFYLSFDKIQGIPYLNPILGIVHWYEDNVVGDAFNNMEKKRTPIYIFMDEIQDMVDWSIQLKFLTDHQDCHVCVTGSSALRILFGKANLPGRASWHELSMLSLHEIALFRGMGNLTPYTTGNNVERWREKDFWIELGTFGNNSPALDDAYKIFSELGGYPVCHAKNQTWDDVEEFLENTVVGRTIEQDVVVKFQQEGLPVPSISTLQHLFYVLCKFNGKDVHLATIQRELKEGFSENLKHEQIRKYLDFFEDSMLVRIIKPTEHRLKDARERVKVCLCDHALRRAVIGESVSLVEGGAVANDLVGSIAEGIVGAYLSLFPRIRLNYLPGKDAEDEVDFIINIGDFRIPVEVKYQNNPTVSRGIKQYLEKPQYNTKFGLLLTKDTHWVKDNIIAIPVKNFLLLK